MWNSSTPHTKREINLELKIEVFSFEQLCQLVGVTRLKEIELDGECWVLKKSQGERKGIR